MRVRLNHPSNRGQVCPRRVGGLGSTCLELESTRIVRMCEQFTVGGWSNFSQRTQVNHTFIFWHEKILAECVEPHISVFKLVFKYKVTTRRPVYKLW